MAAFLPPATCRISLVDLRASVPGFARSPQQMLYRLVANTATLTTACGGSADVFVQIGTL
jgi:hypothetical protein